MAKADLKTTATEVSAADYFAAQAEPRRSEAVTIDALFARVTGQQAKMWGPSIVGFGSYHYRYESGREGDSCLVGFTSRKGDISVYLSSGFPTREALLARLGKHKMAKACLYISKLSDVDLTVLEKLVRDSVAEVKRLYA